MPYNSNAPISATEDRGYFHVTGSHKRSNHEHKTKKTEGHDRIPERILIDGINILIKPFTWLFNLIYTTKQIPEQWLLAKIIPVFKKGDRNNVANYRPIANL